jgi:hypothetical protein
VPAACRRRHTAIATHGKWHDRPRGGTNPTRVNGKIAGVRAAVHDLVLDSLR